MASAASPRVAAWHEHLACRKVAIAHCSAHGAAGAVAGVLGEQSAIKYTAADECVVDAPGCYQRARRQAERAAAPPLLRLCAPFGVVRRRPARERSERRRAPERSEARVGRGLMRPPREAGRRLGPSRGVFRVRQHCAALQASPRAAPFARPPPESLRCVWRARRSRPGLAAVLLGADGARRARAVCQLPSAAAAPVQPAGRARPPPDRSSHPPPPGAARAPQRGDVARAAAASGNARSGFAFAPPQQPKGCTD